MAERATIARPYAEALFKAASADLNGAALWVEELAVAAGSEQLQQLADNPKVSDEQVFDLISGVLGTSLSDIGRNFLRTVIGNGRLNVLPEICEQFRALKNAQSGSSDAIVYSAFPVEGAALAEVAGTLEKRFGRKLNLTVELQPALIGGIRVVVGDEVLDTSVRARLDQMKVALAAS
jgi:F-type H+-transporting ATPase subunit delta